MYEIKADSGNAETKWSQQTVCNEHRTGMPGVRHQEFNYRDLCLTRLRSILSEN